MYRVKTSPTFRDLMVQSEDREVNRSHRVRCFLDSVEAEERGLMTVGMCQGVRGRQEGAVR